MHTLIARVGDRQVVVGAGKGGVVVGLDPDTGRVRCQTPVPGDPLGGVTVVNDLALIALLDGTIVALDRADGHTVWTTQTTGGINGWMSVAGDTLVVLVGNASPPQRRVTPLPDPPTGGSRSRSRTRPNRRSRPGPPRAPARRCR